MKTKIVLFIAAFLTWLLFTWSLDLRHLLIGAAAAILVSFMTSDIFATDAFPEKNIARYLWFLYYIPVFVWECVKANIDGMYRVLHPDLPINPGIVKVSTCIKSDIGLTFLANSITLMPGTMTVDVDQEKGFLYIHWVDVKSRDTKEATRLIVLRFERILKRIFE